MQNVIKERKKKKKKKICILSNENLKINRSIFSLYKVLNFGLVLTIVI